MYCGNQPLFEQNEMEMGEMSSSSVGDKGNSEDPDLTAPTQEEQSDPRLHCLLGPICPNC